jgi:hypothetical protein
MDITSAMLRAARAAEFEYYQHNRGRHDRFQPIADGLMRAVINAAISAIGEDDEPEPQEVEESEQAPPRPVQPTRIVKARKPRPRCYGDR